MCHCRLGTAVFSLSIVWLVAYTLGLFGSLVWLNSFLHFCISIQHFSRCFHPWVVQIFQWVTFAICLFNVVSSVCLVAGIAWRRKCLVLVWTVVQAADVFLWCATFGFWIGYLKFGYVYPGYGTPVAFSTLAFIGVLFVDLAFLALVIVDSFPDSLAAKFFRFCLVECVWLFCLGREKRNLWV